jgi:AcrR family transcriptional regulator
MTSSVSTRRRDALANSERLIAAARKVFASGGQGSLAEIAGEAGVGIATLYRHFSGRESLTRAVYRSIMRDELLPLLRQPRAQGSARQSFLLIVERLLDLLDRERGLIVSSANFAVLTDDLLREFLEPFAVLLQHAQQANEIRADLQPYDIPRVLSILVVGLSTPPASPADRRRYASLAFDAMRPDRAEPLPALDEKDGVEGMRRGFTAIRLATSSREPDSGPLDGAGPQQGTPGDR